MSEGGAGLVEFSGRFGGDLFIFVGGQYGAARKRLPNNFEQAANGVRFVGREEVDESAGLLAFLLPSPR